MNIHELALHYCNKYGIMHIKISSKYETRRFAISVNAEVNNICRKAERPVPVGYCDVIEVQEVGDKKVIVCKDESSSERDVSTIVLRAATENVLNDVALAIGNGINVAKVAVGSNEFLPGAGATELELGLQLKKLAAIETGLEQYSIRAFAEALEIIPRVLAETAGMNADNCITKLVAEHSAGKTATGVNIEAAGTEDLTVSAVEACVFDSEAVKLWAFRNAVDAACSILRVDQVVMRKQAGGPKPQEPGQQ